jgi:glycerol uptake facilitator-like aquaporin
VFVAAFGDISGGHFNPAVTIASQQRECFQPVALHLRSSPNSPAPSLLPACSFWRMTGWSLTLATLVDTQRITFGGAFMFEAVGTGFLVIAVLLTAVRSPSRLAPAAIGMTITLCILGFGVLTGSSINPARTIGPAVATGLYREVPLYIAAQLVGAIFAGALYRWFWVQRRPVGNLTVQSSEAAE